MSPSPATEHERREPRRPGDPSRPDGPDGGPPSGIEVELSDTQSHLRVGRDDLEHLIRDTLKIEGVERASISLVLVDNATIREINRRQLGHDWPTDVITFPLSSPGDDVLAGELVVSGEMARDEAAAGGHGSWPELALYIVHGLLHLRGYDDLREPDAAAMRLREGEVLGALGLINPFSLVDHRHSHANANGSE